MQASEPEGSDGPGESRGKRLIQAGIAVFLVAGVVAGLTLLPADWSWIRRSLGGLVMGAGIALMVFAWRLLVYDDSEDGDSKEDGGEETGSG
jgi:protein-S-isoprenylcysteine O-methyltransferase Ste14